MEEILKGILMNKELCKVLIFPEIILHYINSNYEFKEQIKNIEIFYKQEDIEIIRTYLKEKNMYLEYMDSLYYQLKNKKDYGVHVDVNGIEIDFCPYEIVEDNKNNYYNVIQRNFDLPVVCNRKFKKSN